MPPIVPADVVAEQLRVLGVREGAVLLVHTSFRRVGPVEGGPVGLIGALRRAVGPAGTLVMPSWSEDGVFDPATSETSPELGIVAREFWRLPGVLRTEHAHAFAAWGPEASRILSDPLPIPPHRPESPVGRVHDLGGQVLLLGVNHDADTTIHLAEVIAGVRYGKWKTCVEVVDGRSSTRTYLENDHCCARFGLVDEWLDEAGVQAKATVGHAIARMAGAREIVSIVTGRLAHDPLVFLHEPAHGCAECDEARANIPD